MKFENELKDIECQPLDYRHDKELLIRMSSPNPVIGDLEGNAKLILDEIEKAKADGVQFLVLPELILTGYPPEDLLLYKDFLDRCEKKIFEIAKASEGIYVAFGAPRHISATESFLAEKTNDSLPILINQDEFICFNTAVLVGGGKVRGNYYKHALPNYGVFNEKRFFQPGNQSGVFRLNGYTIALTVCEDIWEERTVEALSRRIGAATPELIVNLSASLYQRGKAEQRRQVVKHFSKRVAAPIVYCNMFGATDQLVFDGHSLVVNRDKILAESIPFGLSGENENLEVYNALRTALKDYTGKNGFQKVVLGLSGGLDSALVALLAVDALGAENVSALVMPTKYSSDETQSDAVKLAEALKIRYQVLPIEDLRKNYETTLWDSFGGDKNVPDATEENIQARIRGNLLMAWSNKFSEMVIATGNKSELSVGYSTLYGDMSGGFSLIKDVLKTEAFALTQWRIDQSKDTEVKKIVQSIIDRPPSAELRSNQKDSDSLPAYPILDQIIARYVEQKESAESIIKFFKENPDASRGNEFVSEDEIKNTVLRVIHMVNRAEHKRQQSSPGPKIRTNAFGSERRMPIINRYS